MGRTKKPLVTVTLTERFATSALSYIISRWDTWDFRPETDKSRTLDAL